jgi:U32 family peptidase
MNIVVPLDSTEGVKELVSAGAAEFFAGVVTDSWAKKYSSAGSINRRESKLSNFSDYPSLAKATRLAHDLGAKVFLTLNAHYYIEEQYQFIDEALDNAVMADVDAVIVADIGLMEHIKEARANLDLHVSSEAMVLNGESVAFFRQFGVTRIICPREISPAEIAALTKTNRDLEFESFILRERCPFAGGLCQPTHGITKNYFCAFGWRHRYFNYENPIFSTLQEREIRNNDMYYSMWAGHSGSVIATPSCLDQEVEDEIRSQRCGICSIPSLKTSGISSLKISGRGLPLARKIEYVRFIRRALDYLQNEIESYEQFCRLLKGNSESCDLTYNCYYR